MTKTFNDKNHSKIVCTTKNNNNNNKKNSSSTNESYDKHVENNVPFKLIKLPFLRNLFFRWLEEMMRVLKRNPRIFYYLLENSPNKIRALIGLKSCFYLSNRPFFVWFYWHNKPRGNLGEHEKSRKALLRKAKNAVETIPCRLLLSPCISISIVVSSILSSVVLVIIVL